MNPLRFMTVLLRCYYDASTVLLLTAASRHNRRTVVLWSWWIGMNLDESGWIVMPDDTPINPNSQKWWRILPRHHRNDPDPATVELRPRPRPQSSTIHPDTFKRFNLVVALSSRFPNHRDSSRVITVLLRLTPVHHDGATVLLRIMLMYPDLTNRGES